MDGIIESTVNAGQGNVVDSQTQTTTTEPVKTAETTVNAGNGEVTTSTVENKPVQSQEENAKYAQIRRDYESRLTTETQKARDSFIASQGYSWNGKSITTEAEYNQALAEQAEQQRQEQLRQQGIDPKVIEEAVNSNPAVKWANEYKSKQEQEQAKQKQFLEFSEAYPNVKGEEIPPEVWQEFNKGTPLKIAYAIHENSKLRAELEAIKKGTQTNASNLKNAQGAIGSVTGQSNLPTDFITKDVFEANKKDQSWLSKNYDLLRNSMPKW